MDDAEAGVVPPPAAALNRTTLLDDAEGGAAHTPATRVSRDDPRTEPREVERGTPTSENGYVERNDDDDDDENNNNNAGDDAGALSPIGGDVAFADDDTVAAPPHARFAEGEVDISLLLLPGNLADEQQPHQHRLVVGRLPHPRHGKLVRFVCVDDSTLLEVQEHRPAFATWFIGNSVVPDRPLYVATHFDVTFISLFLAMTKNEQMPKFVEAREMLDVDPRVASLPPVVQREIVDRLHDVCEVKHVGNESFMRFCPRAALEWILRKHQAVVGSGCIRKLLRSEDETLNRAKSLALVLEYVPKALHAEVLEKCGVGAVSVAAQRSAATTIGSHFEPSGEVGLAGDELSAKRARKEPAPKSLNVRRLEKAGAPKGTPSIMSMFARAAQKKNDASQKQ